MLLDTDGRCPAYDRDGLESLIEASGDRQESAPQKTMDCRGDACVAAAAAQ